MEDLAALSRAFSGSQGEGLVRGTGEAVLAPNFEGSLDVGGADADTILDGLLVDVKATVMPKVTAEMLRQLLGYALLDYGDRYGMREVAVYMARQTRLVRWDLGDLLLRESGGPEEDLAALRSVFRDALRARGDGVGEGP